MTDKIDLEPGETCPHCGQTRRKKKTVTEAVKKAGKEAAQKRWNVQKEKEQQEAINKLNNLNK